MSDTAKVTPLRRGLLEAVSAGEVEFRASSADWFVRGTPARGWNGRSLRKMSGEQLISVSGGRPSDLVQARLTEAGQAALASTAEPGPDSAG